MDKETYIITGHSLDPESARLLKEIAELEAEGERPNTSKAVRRMVREKAKVLGLLSKLPSKKKNYKKERIA